MNNWINEVLEQHKEYESPQSFWYWSGLFTISAVVKDNVCLDKFAYKLYPNIYVMLHADSGLRKGPPVAMAKQLLARVDGIKMIVGRSSIQGIMKEMSQTHTMPGGKIVSNSAAAIISSELSSSIVEDPAALNILTDLYDRIYNADDWKTLLKSETGNLKSPTVCMLTATNQAHSNEFLQAKDVRGGFLARTFIVRADKPNRINSLMYAPQVKTDYNHLAQHLKELAVIKGEMKMTDGARRNYDKWYQAYMNSVLGSEIKDPTGTVNRLGENVLKVAMLLSLAKDNSLVIDNEHLDEAVIQCESLIANVRKSTHGLDGKSPYAQHKAQFIFELLNRDNYSISHRMLVHKYHMNGSSEEWKSIANDMQVAGVIDIENVGAETMYVMKPAAAEKLSKHFAGKLK